MDAYQKDVKEVFSGLKSDEHGLSTEQAKRRLKEYGKNEITEGKKITPFQILIAQFKDVLIWILIFAAVVSGVLGEYVDSIVIGIILVLNAILGFVQEYKAEKAIEALRKIASLKAKVMRDGEEVHIDASQLVPGDIIVLETGDKIPADSRLISLSNLETQEAALTGESTPVTKALDALKKCVVADRINMVFSGTIVTRGRATAVVTDTGMKSEIGKIAKIIQKSKRPLTPLQKKLKHFGKVLTFLILGICVVVFVAGVMRGRDMMEMFLTSVSLAVAAVPEGLPAVVTITLAIGVVKLSKKNALIRKLPSVETLGATTIICTDKTGTLTHNKMTVKKVYVDQEVISVSGEGYAPEGKFAKDSKSLKQLLKIGALCNDAKFQHKETFGDPTELALIISAAKAGLKREDLEKNTPRVDEIPFDSERKLMSTIHKQNRKKYMLTKGGAEQILDKCTRIMEKGRVRLIKSQDRKRILDMNDKFASEALRVLGFAFKEMDKKEEKGLVFVGLQAMIDPPRESAKESVKKCQEAGIRVMMITGDHKITAVAIAKEIGITGEVMTGQELIDMKDDELKRKIETVGIFARVNPEHKSRIVDALKHHGHVVAMTGDGVNDAPALKKADIGISMGIAGTDVAKEASAMILVDDDFTSIVDAVEEGRSIFDNIQKFVEYLLSCNLGEVMVIFFAIMFGWNLPLIAIMILWMNLLTDGMPALALGVEPEEPGIMKRKPRKVKNEIVGKKGFIRMLITGLIMTVGTLSVFMWYNPAENLRLAQTMAFTTLVCFQLFQALNCRSVYNSIFKIGLFRNKWMWGAILASLGLQFAILYTPLNQIFRVLPIGLAEWGVIIAVSSSVFILREIVKLFSRKA